MRLSATVLLAVLVPLWTFAAPSDVSLDGRRLMVGKRLPDGTLAPPEPYVIRGVVWSPASRSTNTSPSDRNNAAVRRAELDLWDDTDVPLLAGMNVNTVRLMVDPGPDAAGRSVLDRLYAHGIMVVMTVDNGVNDLERIRQVVPFFRDHPAILMWSLGSEWNLNRYFNAATSVADAARRTELAAALVKGLDPLHPVASSYGDIDSDTARFVNEVCPSVDVWGLNVYRGKSFGALFSQWAGITAKPMFVGEYGTDAFRSSAGRSYEGSVDGIMQADWDLALWDELFGHLSAKVPEAVALGGFVFAFNDEWWKVSPPDSQQRGGPPGPHADGIESEEYFGIFDIDRNPRSLRDVLENAFDPAYTPARTHAFRVMSRGLRAEEYSSQCGVAEFFLDGARFYSEEGCSTTGRGIHIAVFNPETGALQQPIAHFDTWRSSTGFCMASVLLDMLPNGMIVLIGVADEAGLTQWPPNDCIPTGSDCRTHFVRRVQAMGGWKVGQYCYWSSWAFAAVKGEGVAREENLLRNAEVSARVVVPRPARTLSVAVTGAGVVRSVPAGVDCTASCDAKLPLAGGVTLHAVPQPGWYFSSWGGACSGQTCSVAMSEDRAVTATFKVQTRRRAARP